MTPLNYNHLYYFCIIAKAGSITKASKQLHLKPQTLSGQLSAFEGIIGSQLFFRTGKKLILSDVGKTVLNYAEQIFQIGDEPKAVIKQQISPSRLVLAVGIMDVIPKTFVLKLITPLLKMKSSIKIVCIEGNFDNLLAEFALNKLDIIIADQPLYLGGNIKANNHLLIETGLTFFCSTSMPKIDANEFPTCLNGVDFIMHGKNSYTNKQLQSWFDNKKIIPNIIAEFDDTALIKAFAKDGYGIFAVSSSIETEIISQYDFRIIGRTDEVKEKYYAITHNRKIKNPAIIEILKAISELSPI